MMGVDAFGEAEMGGVSSVWDAEVARDGPYGPDGHGLDADEEAGPGGAIPPGNAELDDLMLSAQLVHGAGAQQALGARFQIRSIPTLALFAGGREIARQPGAMGQADILRWVKMHLPVR
jgi:hypothetical protein